MQRAQVFDRSNGPIEYREVPIAKPGPDEVLVHIKYTGGEFSVWCYCDSLACF